MDVTEKQINSIRSSLKADQRNLIETFAGKLHEAKCNCSQCTWISEKLQDPKCYWITGSEHRIWFMKAYNFWKFGGNLEI